MSRQESLMNRQKDAGTSVGQQGQGKSKSYQGGADKPTRRLGVFFLAMSKAGVALGPFLSVRSIEPGPDPLSRDYRVPRSYFIALEYFSEGQLTTAG